MATKTKKAVNKSAFVRDFIQKNPQANRRTVEEAWLAAGHEGVISSALVSGLRAKLGLTGNVRKQSEADAKPATISVPALEKSGKPKGIAGATVTGRGREPKQAQAEANGMTAGLGSRGAPTAHSVDRPMATGRGGNQGKTAFVTEHLQQDPNATDDEINQAWKAAGNEGGISGSLIYKIRAKEGLTGKRGAKGRGTGKKGLARPSPKGAMVGRSPEPMAGTPRSLIGVPNRGRVVAELEEDIDRLIFKLMSAGGMETIEDELRKVRRLLYRSCSE